MCKNRISESFAPLLVSFMLHRFLLLTPQSRFLSSSCLSRLDKQVVAKDTKNIKKKEASNCEEIQFIREYVIEYRWS